MVTASDKKYGPIGVVFALMSWLIAIGVVIILSAVAGVVWRERNLWKRLRRTAGSQASRERWQDTAIGSLPRFRPRR